MNAHKLYGMPASLYTAKARSYLRKQGIPFAEYGANHPDFAARVIPKVGRFIVPVVETPSGEILQDGTDIIDHFEHSGEAAFSVYPASTVVRTISLLFELFGGEGLLRPAMHYRWNFDDTNMSFIRNEFIAALAPVGASKEEGDAFFDRSSGRMRKAAVGFGVSDEARPLIEESYAQFLQLFAEHLRSYPYLMGGRATIGDFGLVSALYGHLNRDPAPTLLMRQRAPEVSRWVERMHSPGEVWVEHSQNPELVGADAVPDTLMALLSYVAEEYLPEIEAHVAFANEWLRARPDLQPGTNGLKNPANRFIGEATFDWRGITLTTAVLPYRFYLLQRIQDCYASAAESDQRAIETLLTSANLSALLELKTLRRVERVNYLEVWGELRQEVGV
ncbi:MAG: hypothetical protein Cons2KO_04730 [Congregibacter sp.]